MNRLAKILIILGLCLMCAGLLISQGDVRGLISSVNRDRGNYNVNTFSELPGTLTINTINDRIKIIPTDNDSIQIGYFEDRNLDYELKNENGNLSLTAKSRRTFPRVFFSFNIRTPDMTIEIPRDLVLVYDIQTTNGGISIKNLSGDNSHFSTTNGSIELSNIFMDKVVISTTNGRISMNDLTSLNVSAETTNGIIEFNNLNSNQMTLNSTNGSIRGTIIGDINSYWMDLRTTNGKIRLNGEDFGTRKRDTHLNRNNTINARLTNGNITIDFR